MKLSFHGAARTVTGSKHLITLDNGKKILLDCGMFQGLGKATDDLNDHFGFKPETIDYLFLSHAHIDHSGLIPKLVKEGFKGRIICTEATKDLTEILLYDSAEIQTYEIDIINRKREKQSLKPFEALYSADDVTASMQFFETIESNKWINIDNDIEVYLNNTGHLIGSVALNFKFREKGKTTTLSFSGDVGRYQSVLLPSPSEFPQADYIIIESTYGDKRHELNLSGVKILNSWIQKTCVERGGKLIIPAFSVGRTQEVLYVLNQLSLEKRLPEINFYVDSPLSLKATEVIKKYTDQFNDRLQQVLKIDDDPFHFEGLKYIETVEDSRKLMEYKEPCVIISASGTADAGRVRHHIFSCVNEPINSVLLVGYCSNDSLGGQLLDGAKEVELFGEPCSVAAEVGKMTGLSAHGDCDDLTKYLDCQDAEKVKKIFLVHGEYKVQQEFAARLERKGFTNIEIPSQHQEYELE